MAAHRHRVLYIEDHDDTRGSTEALLRLHDFDVVAVEGARAGLTRFREGFQCCIILLDWRMPGMNGEEFRHEQMADERLARIPVIVLSADRPSTEQAYHLGIRGLLRKPADPIQLIATMERYCECAPD